MKIAILDDYQNVASGLADWDSLAAEVVAFTKAFADGDDAVRNLTPEAAAEHGARAVTKQQLFTESDVLSIHVVLSKRMRGLVAAAELRSMKPSAVLVNTSRGPVVDEAALVGVLSEGRIRAAAIDIFDTEPLPADHQLRSLPNALLTGHVAYVTRDLYTIFYQDAVEDIAAYQAGSPPSG
jgi:phosphoglycerate dehydrogenase-like enzyme